MKDIEDFKEAMKIDRDDLDVELVRQPVLYQEVAEAHALAASRTQECRETYKRVEAEQSTKFREEYEDEHGKKPTEAQVIAGIQMNRLYQKARDLHLDASHQEMRWAALKETAQQRAYVLKDLAGLWVAGYYQNSSVHSENSVAAQEAATENRRKQMNKNRRRLRNKE